MHIKRVHMKTLSSVFVDLLFRFSLKPLWAIISYWAESLGIYNPAKHPWWKSSAKTTNSLYTLTVSTKKQLRRIKLDSKWISDWQDVVNLGFRWPQVHRICIHKLVDREVVDARSNYKISYLWWFRNLACGNSTWSNLTKKDQLSMLPGLAWEKEWCDLVYVERP